MSATSRELVHPEADEIVLTEVLFALSDPARLGIARLLLDGPIEVAKCHTVTGDIPKSTLSHHLKTLREAGVIRSEPHGRGRFVSLRRDDLDRRFPGLIAAVLGPDPR